MSPTSSAMWLMPTSRGRAIPHCSRRPRPSAREPLCDEVGGGEAAAEGEAAVVAGARRRLRRARADRGEARNRPTRGVEQPALGVRPDPGRADPGAEQAQPHAEERRLGDRPEQRVRLVRRVAGVATHERVRAAAPVGIVAVVRRRVEPRRGLDETVRVDAEEPGQRRQVGRRVDERGRVLAARRRRAEPVPLVMPLVPDEEAGDVAVAVGERVLDDVEPERVVAEPPALPVDDEGVRQRELRAVLESRLELRRPARQQRDANSRGSPHVRARRRARAGSRPPRPSAGAALPKSSGPRPRNSSTIAASQSYALVASTTSPSKLDLAAPARRRARRTTVSPSR